MVVELAQKIFVSAYLDRMYPYLKEKNVQKLSKEEIGEIAGQTKALVFHKVGDMARLQTRLLLALSLMLLQSALWATIIM